ncbi:MAG: response regulator [Deltaproteobacteria bacterium]|jgi:DNA-binding NtrC family response regulator|nr:response regulator [Deltaproteobacteria bacterium]
MVGLLIADKNVETRRQMASLLINAGYDVMVTDSAVKAIDGVLKKTAQIVLLGSALDELTSAELIPLLKHCNPHLMIILIADDAPLPMIRKARTEGIFYHALRPAEPEDEEEIRQVVKCALENLNRTTYARKPLPH